MPLPILTFQQSVDMQASAMQAASQVVLDFTVGSVLRSSIESNSGIFLWLESDAQKLLAVTRLSTSTGNDVDTFIAQFGLKRIAAVPASGFVTLSRFTANLQAIINVGSSVFSISNGVSYAIQPDTTNIYFSPSNNAYILPSGIQSISVPVIAVTAGSIGNVLANQITTIQSVIYNIDSVTNPSAFVSGADQESDAAVKVRFPLYLESLSKGTYLAILSAVLGVPGVVRQNIVGNYDTLGNPLPGFFYVVVDDGTGNASSTLLSNVQSAVELIRAFTISFSVYAPTPVSINTSSHVFTDGSIPDSTVESAVIAAQQNYVNSQDFNSVIRYSEIPRVIYDANISLSGNNYSPIINVTNWLLNGGTSDVPMTNIQIAVPGSITVTMNA